MIGSTSMNKFHRKSFIVNNSSLSIPELTNSYHQTSAGHTCATATVVATTTSARSTASQTWSRVGVTYSENDILDSTTVSESYVSLSERARSVDYRHLLMSATITASAAANATVNDDDNVFSEYVDPLMIHEQSNSMQRNMSEKYLNHRRNSGNKNKFASCQNLQRGGGDDSLNYYCNDIDFNNIESLGGETRRPSNKCSDMYSSNISLSRINENDDQVNLMSRRGTKSHVEYQEEHQLLKKVKQPFKLFQSPRTSTSSILSIERFKKMRSKRQSSSSKTIERASNRKIVYAKNLLEQIQNLHGQSTKTDLGDQDENKILNILIDVYKSELSYFNLLKKAFEIYAEPLRKFSSLSLNDYNVLFAYIEPIISLSYNLSMQLEKIIKAWPCDLLNSGKLFGKKLFHSYEEYLANYTSIVKVLNQLQKSDDFNEFFRLRKANTDCSQSLEHILSTPLERIKYYERVLQSLSAYSASNVTTTTTNCATVEYHSSHQSSPTRSYVKSASLTQQANSRSQPPENRVASSPLRIYSLRHKLKSTSQNFINSNTYSFFKRNNNESHHDEQDIINNKNSAQADTLTWKLFMIRNNGSSTDANTIPVNSTTDLNLDDIMKNKSHSLLNLNCRVDDSSLAKLNNLASIQQTFPNDDLHLFDQAKLNKNALSSAATSVPLSSPVTSNSTRKLVNMLTPSNLKSSFIRHHTGGPSKSLITTPIIATSQKLKLFTHATPNIDIPQEAADQFEQSDNNVQHHTPSKSLNPIVDGADQQAADNKQEVSSPPQQSSVAIKITCSSTDSLLNPEPSQSEIQRTPAANETSVTKKSSFASSSKNFLIQRRKTIHDLINLDIFNGLIGGNSSSGETSKSSKNSFFLNRSTQNTPNKPVNFDKKLTVHASSSVMDLSDKQSNGDKPVEPPQRTKLTKMKKSSSFLNTSRVSKSESSNLAVSMVSTTVDDTVCSSQTNNENSSDRVELNISRELIMQGSVQMLNQHGKQDRYLFLFNDLLIVAKQKNENYNKLKYRVPLKQIWLSENCTSESVSATLGSTRSSDSSIVIGWPPALNFIVDFRDSSRKETWIQKLNELIAVEKQKEEGQTVNIRICYNKDNSGGSEPTQYSQCYIKTVQVKPTDTAQDLVDRCKSLFNLDPSSDSSSTSNDLGNNLYQLWLKTNKTERLVPLIGHEFPYEIQVSYLKETAKRASSSSHSNNTINSNNTSTCNIELENNEENHTTMITTAISDTMKASSAAESARFVLINKQHHSRLNRSTSKHRVAQPSKSSNPSKASDAASSSSSVTTAESTATSATVTAPERTSHHRTQKRRIFWTKTLYGATKPSSTSMTNDNSSNHHQSSLYSNESTRVNDSKQQTTSNGVQLAGSNDHVTMTSSSYLPHHQHNPSTDSGISSKNSTQFSSYANSSNMPSLSQTSRSSSMHHVSATSFLETTTNSSSVNQSVSSTLKPLFYSKLRRSTPHLFGVKLEKICGAYSQTNNQLPSQLINLIEKVATEGPNSLMIFRKSASAKLKKIYKEKLDTNQSVEYREMNVHIAALLIKEYLREYPDGVIDYHFFDECIAILTITDADQKLETIKSIMSRMPKWNCVCLINFISLFYLISTHSSTNKMDVHNISVCVAPSIFHKLDRPNDLESSFRTIAFIEYMIENVTSIFEEAGHVIEWLKNLPNASATSNPAENTSNNNNKSTPTSSGSINLKQYGQLSKSVENLTVLNAKQISVMNKSKKNSGNYESKTTIFSTTTTASNSSSTHSINKKGESVVSGGYKGVFNNLVSLKSRKSSSIAPKILKNKGGAASSDKNSASVSANSTISSNLDGSNPSLTNYKKRTEDTPCDLYQLTTEEAIRKNKEQAEQNPSNDTSVNADPNFDEMTYSSSNSHHAITNNVEGVSNGAVKQKNGQKKRKTTVATTMSADAHTKLKSRIFDSETTSDEDDEGLTDEEMIDDDFDQEDEYDEERQAIGGSNHMDAMMLAAFNKKKKSLSSASTTNSEYEMSNGPRTDSLQISTMPRTSYKTASIQSNPNGNQHDIKQVAMRQHLTSRQNHDLSSNTLSLDSGLSVPATNTNSDPESEKSTISSSHTNNINNLESTVTTISSNTENLSQSQLSSTSHQLKRQKRMLALNQANSTETTESAKSNSGSRINSMSKRRAPILGTAMIGQQFRLNSLNESSTLVNNTLNENAASESCEMSNNSSLRPESEILMYDTEKISIKNSTKIFGPSSLINDLITRPHQVPPPPPPISTAAIRASILIQLDNDSEPDRLFNQTPTKSDDDDLSQRLSDVKFSPTRVSSCATIDKVLGPDEDLKSLSSPSVSSLYSSRKTNPAYDSTQNTISTLPITSSKSTLTEELTITEPTSTASDAKRLSRQHRSSISQRKSSNNTTNNTTTASSSSNRKSIVKINFDKTLTLLAHTNQHRDLINLNSLTSSQIQSGIGSATLGLSLTEDLLTPSSSGSTSKSNSMTDLTRKSDDLTNEGSDSGPPQLEASPPRPPISLRKSSTVYVPFSSSMDLKNTANKSPSTNFWFGLENEESGDTQSTNTNHTAAYSSSSAVSSSSASPLSTNTSPNSSASSTTSGSKIKSSVRRSLSLKNELSDKSFEISPSGRPLINVNNQKRVEYEQAVISLRHQHDKLQSHAILSTPTRPSINSRLIAKIYSNNTSVLDGSVNDSTIMHPSSSAELVLPTKPKIVANSNQTADLDSSLTQQRKLSFKSIIEPNTLLNNKPVNMISHKLLNSRVSIDSNLIALFSNKSSKMDNNNNNRLMSTDLDTSIKQSPTVANRNTPGSDLGEVTWSVPHIRRQFELAASAASAAASNGRKMSTIIKPQQAPFILRVNTKNEMETDGRATVYKMYNDVNGNPTTSV